MDCDEVDDDDDDVFVNSDDPVGPEPPSPTKRRSQSLSALSRDEPKSPRKVRILIHILNDRLLKNNYTLESFVLAFLMCGF